MSKMLIDKINDSMYVYDSVIVNVNSANENRIGDYGRDADGLPYIFTKTGWRCIQEDRRCAIFWQRKYMELLKETKQKRKIKK